MKCHSKVTHLGFYLFVPRKKEKLAEKILNANRR